MDLWVVSTKPSEKGSVVVCVGHRQNRRVLAINPGPVPWRFRGVTSVCDRAIVFDDLPSHRTYIPERDGADGGTKAEALAKGSYLGASMVFGGAYPRVAFALAMTQVSNEQGIAVPILFFAAGIAMGGAKSGPTMCFPKGTSIATQTGSKKIEDIAVGDMVLAFDASAKDTVSRRVSATIRGSTLIWIDIGTSDRSSTRSTRYHPFWVESHQRWVHAFEVEPGMQLRRASGGLTKVISVSVTFLDHAEETFNFEVEGLHNYYAGEGQLLVHNQSPSPETLLGLKHANKSAHESAKVFQIEQAKRARGLVPSGVRIDIPKGDPTHPGFQPHAHGKGWSVNIDGSLHDAKGNLRSIPGPVKDALRKAGWGC